MRCFARSAARRLVRAVAATGLLALVAASTGAGSLPAQVTPARAQQSVDCSAPAASPDSIAADPQYVRITFTNQCGQQVPLGVDIAADDARQQRGLMEVENLPADQGELFIFDNLQGGAEIHVGFWMEDTPLPLSIAFIGKDETVHEIQDMAPETTTIHLPSQPYLYAVEANEGWFSDHGISAGSTVNLAPALTLIAGSASQ